MKWIFGLCVAFYAALLVILVLNENRLVYPTPGMRGDWQPADISFEEVNFKSKDDTDISGWFLPAPKGLDRPPRTLLLCHGNGENVAMATAHMGDELRQFLGANVLVFDYRGYGKSEGAPHEQGILMDAEAAMSWLNKKTDTMPQDVIVVGHSIGGGPACHLASKIGAKALVLQRTFASLPDAAKSNFWFIPVDRIMSNRYPSAEKIRTCDVPLFQSHGDRDYLVPISSGKKIFENSPSKNKQFYLNSGGGHWDRLPKDYWNQLAVFINGLETDDIRKPTDKTPAASTNPTN